MARPAFTQESVKRVLKAVEAAGKEVREIVADPVTGEIRAVLGDKQPSDKPSSEHSEYI